MLLRGRSTSSIRLRGAVYCQSRKYATVPTANEVDHTATQSPALTEGQTPERPRVSSILTHYWDTTPPEQSQLTFAKQFFHKKPAELLFTAAKLHQVTFTDIPEVAFFGRSNVGKSSILNALMNTQLCYVSAKPGKTRTMNAFAVGGPDRSGQKHRLTVLDMPGYGKASRPEWGKHITKYLLARKELKRAFLLVNAAHGLKHSDEVMLQLFRENAIPHQIVLSKIDMFLKLKSTYTQSDLADAGKRMMEFVERLKEKIQPRDGLPPALGEVIACSVADQYSQVGGKLDKRRTGLGLPALRHAVLAAVGIGPGGEVMHQEPAEEENFDSSAGRRSSKILVQDELDYDDEA